MATSKLSKRIQKRLEAAQGKGKGLLGFSMHPSTFADLADEPKANGKVYRCVDESIVAAGVYGRYMHYAIMIDNSLEPGKINPVFSTLKKKKTTA